MNSTDIFQLLLKIQAIKIDTHNPFIFSSGIRSPIYCDNRILISETRERNLIIDAFIEKIKSIGETFDVIAGTATAGIPHAAWIADRLNKPMIYIRSKAKAHGTKNQIEGRLQPGKKVCLIEDLISTGGSAINAINAIQQANAEVSTALLFSTTTYCKRKTHLMRSASKCIACPTLRTAWIIRLCLIYSRKTP